MRVSFFSKLVMAAMIASSTMALSLPQPTNLTELQQSTTTKKTTTPPNAAESVDDLIANMKNKGESAASTVKATDYANIKEAEAKDR